MDMPWGCSHRIVEPRHLAGSAALADKRRPCTVRKVQVSGRRGARHALPWWAGSGVTSSEMGR